MNNCSLLSRLGLLLALPLLLSACGRNKQADPTPKEYAVSVHVTGSDMLSGSTIINSTYDYAGSKGAPVAKPVFTRIYATTVDETYDLGKFGTADQIRVRIEMSANTYKATLAADIIVDGMVQKHCFITGGGVFTVCELATDTL